MEIVERGGKVVLKKGPGPGCHPVWLDGEVFESIRTAATGSGFSSDTVAKGCNASQLPDGRPIRYATKEEVESFVSNGRNKKGKKAKGKVKKSRGKKRLRFSARAHQYLVGGVVYRTKQECLATLRICADTLQGMIKDGLAERVSYEDYKAFIELQREERKTPAKPVLEVTVFQGIVWGDGGVTVRIPGTTFSMTRSSKEEIPGEISSMCEWK